MRCFLRMPLKGAPRMLPRSMARTSRVFLMQRATLRQPGAMLRHRFLCTSTPSAATTTEASTEDPIADALAKGADTDDTTWTLPQGAKNEGADGVSSTPAAVGTWYDRATLGAASVDTALSLLKAVEATDPALADNECMIQGLMAVRKQPRLVQASIRKAVFRVWQLHAAATKASSPAITNTMLLMSPSVEARLEVIKYAEEHGCFNDGTPICAIRAAGEGPALFMSSHSALTVVLHMLETGVIPMSNDCYTALLNRFLVLGAPQMSRVVYDALKERNFTFTFQLLSLFFDTFLASKYAIYLKETGEAIARLTAPRQPFHSSTLQQAVSCSLSRAERDCAAYFMKLLLRTRDAIAIQAVMSNFVNLYLRGQTDRRRNTHRGQGVAAAAPTQSPPTLDWALVWNMVPHLHSGTRHRLTDIMAESEETLDQAYYALESVRDEAMGKDAEAEGNDAEADASASGDGAAAVSIKTFNIMINACCRRGDMNRAYATFTALSSFGLSPNVYSFNHLLAASVQSRNAAAAESIFGQMKVQNVEPDESSYFLLITANVIGRDASAASDNLRAAIDAGCASSRMVDRVVIALTRSNMQDAATMWVTELEGTETPVSDSAKYFAEHGEFRDKLDRPDRGGRGKHGRDSAKVPAEDQQDQEEPEDPEEQEDQEEQEQAAK